MTVLYTVYKVTNKLNNKEYVGFHKTEKDSFVYYAESGSIYADGYMGSGKLIGRALAKYGPENFSQELLFVSSVKEEAENYEREIVNEDYIKSFNTYNIVTGGNVCILHGEQNGFYGKKHSKETLELIVSSRHKTYETEPYSYGMSYVVGTDIVLYNKNQLFEYFNIDNKFDLYRLVYEGKVVFYSEHLQKTAITIHLEREEWIKNAESRKIKKSIETSKRFKGKKRAEDHKKKIGKGVSKYISENPELHKEKMKRINSDPIKIEKTRLKNIGKKRSQESKKKMSLAKKDFIPRNKGSIYAYDPHTLKSKHFNDLSSIPEGYKIGMPQRKRGFTWYNKDGMTKRFFNDDIIPEGWVPGRAKYEY